MRSRCSSRRGRARATEESDAELAEVRAAWLTYWRAQLRVYQEMFRTVRASGWPGLREMLARTLATAGVVESLRALCAALRGRSGAAAPMLAVAADLLDGEGVLSWSQVPGALVRPKAAIEERHRAESTVAPLPPAEVTRPRWHSHRRVWSVDESVSLARGVPELGSGGDAVRQASMP